MASPSPPTASAGRETRLLLVTLGLSVVLLLVLARFRFPDSVPENPASVPTPPLAQLAARATYDDLAKIMDTVERRVGPSMLALELLSPELGSGDAGLPARVAPALRIRDDMALVSLAVGEEVASVVGQGGGPFDVVARDEVRELAVVRVPARAAPTVSVEPLPPSAASSGYVAVVEASRGGPAVRPVYIGRLDPSSDARWSEPLASLGGTLTAQAGSFAFTLEGGFVGLVVARRGLPSLVPAALVLGAADDLAAGRSRRRGELGIVWQALTPAIARATDTMHGAVVAAVAAGGPADGLLAPGDVVQEIQGAVVRSVADARMAAASVAEGDPAEIDVVRAGESMSLTITTGPQAAPASPAPPSTSTSLGLSLRVRPGGIEVTRVARLGAGEAAGLQAGDLITSVQGVPAGRTAVLTDAWASAAEGGSVLLAVSRGDGPVVLALEKP